MRPIKGRLILTGLSLSLALVGTLAAPVRAGTSGSPAIADPTPVLQSHRSAADLAHPGDLLALVQDGLLDWDTALYLLQSGAVEPKPLNDRDSRRATAPAEDDTGYSCDPHPDTPK
jgi:hypothetical protein